MTNETTLQPRFQRVLKLVATLLIALGVGLAIFWARGAITPAAVPTSMELSQLNSPAATIESSGRLIAYSVDYEMDKARKEKTVDHYGEGIRPIVEQAIKNNEDNPNSKSTAENSYQRESALNQVLPDSIGEKFSEADLTDMENSDQTR